LSVGFMNFIGLSLHFFTRAIDDENFI